MALWRYPGRDITGVIARSEKFAGTVEKVIEIVTNNFNFLNRRLSSISTKPGSTCYFHNFSKKIQRKNVEYVQTSILNLQN